jgi:hypothetical protein
VHFCIAAANDGIAIAHTAAAGRASREDAARLVSMEIVADAVLYFSWFSPGAASQS